VRVTSVPRSPPSITTLPLQLTSQPAVFNALFGRFYVIERNALLPVNKI